MAIKVNVLVVDDDDDVHLGADEALAAYANRVAIFHATTIARGRTLSAKHHIDIAFVDLAFRGEKGNTGKGLAFLEELRRDFPSCSRVLITKFGRDGMNHILKYLALPDPESPMLIVDKNPDGHEYFANIVTGLFGARLEQSWNVSGIDEVRTALLAHPRGKRLARATQSNAIDHEISVLLFNLFGQATSATLDGTPPKLVIENHYAGHSGSVALQVHVDYGLDAKGASIVGTRTIAKIGSRAAIRAEAGRFASFIRMGLPSEFRVELLGCTLGDGLGAVCYSLAGGSFSTNILALDQLIARDDVDRANYVIGRLFNPNNKSWDDIRGKPKALKAHFQDEFRVTLHENLEQMIAMLRNAPFGEYRDSGHFVLEGAKLSFPTHIGDGAWGVGVPTCLVHGDLHGGNVMVSETSLNDPRPGVYMIDFANAGFGPRFADAAALGATVRLESLGDQPMTERRFRSLFREEQRLLGLEKSGLAEGESRESPWYKMAKNLNELALANVDWNLVGRESVNNEYARTQLAYAISIFSATWWNKSQRLRIAVWVSSLHARLEASAK